MSRKAMAIVVATLFGISAIWYVALWSPQGASLKKAQATAASAHDKESTLKAQVASLQRQRAQLPALQGQLARLNQAVPVSPDIDKVIDEVNAVGLASGVTLLSLTPPVLTAAAPGATPVVGAVAMPVTLTVSGTYFQLVDFVNRLGTMPRLAVVDSFSLAAPDKTGKITTSIIARAFVVPPPAPPPSKTTTTTTGGTH